MDAGYEVTLRRIAARRTTVVKATTTWAEFPTLWRPMLDEVWACLRADGVTSGCPNVMLYVDGGPSVEIGVLGAESVRLTGNLVASTLPAGLVASTVHRGAYGGIGDAHEAVTRWCAEHGHGSGPAWPRWEIYGPHRADPAELETEVFHMISA